MRESGKLSAGSTYGYNFPQQQRRSVLDRLLFGTFNFLGFVISMSLFVASVSLTSYMLVSAANSPAVITMKTQDVPSDGIERNYYIDKKMLKSVED